MTNLLQEQLWLFGGARCLRPLIKINSKWLRQTDRVLAQITKYILDCTLDWHSDVVKVVVVGLIPRLEVPLRDKAEAIFPCTHIKQQKQTQSDLLEICGKRSGLVNKRVKTAQQVLHDLSSPSKTLQLHSHTHICIFWRSNRPNFSIQ